MRIEKVSREHFPVWKRMRQELYPSLDPDFHDEEMEWIHDSDETECDRARTETREQQQGADQLEQDRAGGRERRHPDLRREPAHRPVPAVAPEPAERLLRAVREHHDREGRAECDLSEAPIGRQQGAGGVRGGT